MLKIINGIKLYYIKSIVILILLLLSNFFLKVYEVYFGDFLNEVIRIKSGC